MTCLPLTDNVSDRYKSSLLADPDVSPDAMATGSLVPTPGVMSSLHAEVVRGSYGDGPGGHRLHEAIQTLRDGDCKVERATSDTGLEVCFYPLQFSRMGVGDWSRLKALLVLRFVLIRCSFSYVCRRIELT